MWRSTSTFMPVAPISTSSRGNDARDDYDLKTSRWQEVHVTAGLDEMSTQNERVESHEMTTWRAAPGIQRVVMSALSKGVLEEAASVQKQQRGSRNEHLGST